MKIFTYLLIIVINICLGTVLCSQSLEVIEVDISPTSEIREAHTAGNELLYITREGFYRLSPLLELDSLTLPPGLTLASNILFNIRTNNFAANSFGQIVINARKGSNTVTLSTDDDFLTYSEVNSPRGQLHYFGKDTLVSFAGVCSDATFPRTSYSYDNGGSFTSSNSGLCPLPVNSKSVRLNSELHLFGTNSSTNSFNPNADCYTNSWFSPESLGGGNSRFRDPTLDFNEGNCGSMNTYISSNGMKFLIENIRDSTVSQVPIYGSISPKDRPVNIGEAPAGILYISPVSREQFIVNDDYERSRVFYRTNISQNFQELLLNDSLGVIQDIEFDEIGNIFFIERNRIFRSNGVNQLSTRIIGKYFFDLNSNCIFDSLDVSIHNDKLLYSTNGNGELIQFVKDGVYNIGVEQGVTEFTSSFDNTIWGICENENKIEVNNDTITIHDIPISPIRECNNLTITFGTTPLIRCFNSALNLNILNTGSTNTNDFTVNLQLDSQLQIMSSNLPYSQSSDTYSFSVNSLRPFQSSKIELEIHIDCNAQLEEHLCLTAQVTDNIDYCSMNLPISYCDRVLGSYDPNDITAFNQSITPDSIFEKGEAIIYRLRFQNTGTADAFNVRIENPIDERLNLSTLEPLSSSDDYTMSLRENKIVFYFDNINLPSEEVDSLGSQGYVTYKINSYPDVENGSVIDNVASIFFDFNSPIETNNSEVLIDKPSSIYEISDNGIKLSPNPTSNELNIIGSDIQYSRYRIYDITGNLLDLGRIQSDKILVSNKGVNGLIIVEIFNRFGDREVIRCVVIN